MTTSSTRPPRTLRLPVVTCLVALFAPGIAPAQVAPATTVTPSTLARYDKNKNNVLDPAELAAMKADEAKAAQAAVKAPAAAAEKEDVITLSPFEVSADQDRGYAASSAMSGTRMNSKLEDLAASVSVITKQQLEDTAAIDINDIFMNEIGTEGTGQYTDMATDNRGDGYYDNVAGNPTGSNRVRGLAQATIAVGGFTASSNIPIDPYNLDAVEISRGANSTIAGLGDAGGVVNLRQSTANVNRETTRFDVRGDSYGGFRMSADINRPIIRNVLSARFSAVYQEVGYRRKPSVDRQTRQQIAFTFRPFKKTSITASYESIHQWASRANSIVPRETISNWIANGRPTYDPISRNFSVNGVRQTVNTPGTLTLASIPAGIEHYGSSAVRNFEYIDDGRVQFITRGRVEFKSGVTPWQPFRTASVYDSRPLWRLPVTTDKNIYDWSGDINLAAPNYETNRASVITANLQQNLYRSSRQNVNMELGWRREDSFNYRRMFIAQTDGVGNTVSLDVTERLIDGRPNPYFLRPFIGGVNPQVYTRPSFTDNYRVQLAYELDFRREKNLLKWLGLHRLNGYKEYRLKIHSPGSMRYKDQVINNTDWTGVLTRNSSLVGNGNGPSMFPMFFMGKTPGGGVEYANTGAVNYTGRTVASQYYGWASNGYAAVDAAGLPTGRWETNIPVDIAEVWFNGNMEKSKVRTAGVSLQSYLWQDRIITTFGKRKDKTYTIGNYWTSTEWGYAVLDNLYNFGQSKRWRFGNTDTKGLVVKPLRGWRWMERTASEGTGVSRWAAGVLRGMNFHYNQSNTFRPEDTAYNVYLEPLPNPTGESKEYGISFNMFDNKFNLRLTRQITTQNDSRGSLGVVNNRAMSLDFDIPGQTRKMDLMDTLTDWERQAHPEYTETQAADVALQKMGYTREFYNSVSGKTITDVNDAESKGLELELQFNPNRYFTLRATGGKQVAMDNNISFNIQKFIAERLPFWTTIKNPNDGTLWWKTNQGGEIPEQYFVQNVQNPVNLAILTQGKRKTQNREYRLNVTTKLELAALGSSSRILNSMSIGGSARWASKASIGYMAGEPDADGVIRTLDRTKPIWDKPEITGDVMLQYRTRLWRNKIRANFQLNIKNIQYAHTRAKGVSVNPDGQYWLYRIVDPRQYVLSASFDL